MRSGTEPLPNIAAFAVACMIRQEHIKEDLEHVVMLNHYLQEQLSIHLPFSMINAQPDIPHVLNFSIPGCKSEVMLRVLEADEVYLSAGSACSKGDRKSTRLNSSHIKKYRMPSSA